MELWKVLGEVAAVFMIILFIMLITVAITVAAIVVAGVIMAFKDRKQEKQMEELPDRMMSQAAAGLKEREECHEDS